MADQLPVVNAPIMDIRRELSLGLRQLTPRQRKFVRVYFEQGAKSISAAGREVGWSSMAASQQMKKPEVQYVRRLYEMLAAEELGISAYSLMTRALEVYDRAMQAEPVLDSQGNETGVFTFAGPTAMKSLEFLRSIARINPEPKGGGVKVNVGVGVDVTAGEGEHVDPERLRRVDELIGRIAAQGADRADALSGADGSVLPAAVPAEPAGRGPPVVGGADPGSATEP